MSSSRQTASSTSRPILPLPLTSTFVVIARRLSRFLNLGERFVRVRNRKTEALAEVADVVPVLRQRAIAEVMANEQLRRQTADRAVGHACLTGETVSRVECVSAVRARADLTGVTVRVQDDWVEVDAMVMLI